jgi:DNA-directed RNA polymerase specialized sigma24 family protein
MTDAADSRSAPARGAPGSPAATPDARDASSLADRVAPHLPTLRRYARALTGSQAAGDSYVAAVLEAAFADRSFLQDHDDARVALYAAFQRLWNAIDLDLPQEPSDAASAGEEAARARLGALSALSRQALLLTAVEGFSGRQAAEVLGVSGEEAARLLAEGATELKRQTTARVMIIEDEPIIAMDVEAIVTEMGHRVVGVADTRDRAVAMALTERPELVLADIQLADGSSGIDAVSDILAAYTAPVIFITAYPDRLLTGARPEPAFLISKPFLTGAVQAAVAQALFFRTPAERPTETH